MTSGTIVKVILDSTYNDYRLTTMEVRFHRFILPEVLTHRVFSRNTSSSRAIPVEKQIQRVLDDPAVPVFWGAKQAGMSAYHEVEDKAEAELTWREGSERACSIATELLALGLHKQIASRVLEPYMWTTMIITSTYWSNFFELRRPPSGQVDPTFPAQPEIQWLATQMYEALQSSEPVKRDKHLPYLTDNDEGLTTPEKMYVSAARCARVSYLNHDGTREVNADIALFKKLVNSKHFSPLEHVAFATLQRSRWANFEGWEQLRRYYEFKI